MGVLHKKMHFIMDKEIGFYGHPEHVLVGKTDEHICYLNRDSTGFAVERIYQGVMPPSYAEKLMGDSDSYTEGKRVYQCDGMPLPEVQVDISSFAKRKKSVLLAHASQHRNLKKFQPYYKLYPGWIYFRIFGKEYFNVLEL